VPTDIPPYALALTAAFMFAFGGQLQHIGLQTLGARSGTMLSIGTNCLVYWLVAPWVLVPEYFLEITVLIFVLVGLVRPALSANLSVAAIRHVGPTLTTALSATSPLFGAGFGILLLGEMLTWQITLGTFGIMLAIFALTRRNKKIPSTWPLWALGLPIAAAMIRSGAHAMTKIGMETIPDPYFAGLVGSTVSFAVTGGLWLATRKTSPIDPKSTGPYWFLVAGFFFGIAVLALNMALLQGDIITVIPIVAASPIFSLLLSIFIFRRETLSPQLFVAIALVVPSVVLIALSQ